MSKSKCICTMAQSLTGDGCRYCQPQEHIDRIEEWLEEERVDHRKLENVCELLLDAHKRSVVDWRAFEDLEILLYR